MAALVFMLGVSPQNLYLGRECLLPSLKGMEFAFLAKSKLTKPWHIPRAFIIVERSSRHLDPSLASKKMTKPHPCWSVLLFHPSRPNP